MKEERYTLFTDLGKINVTKDEFDRVINSVREFEEIEIDSLHEPEIHHDAWFYTKVPYGFIGSVHIWY